MRLFSCKLASFVAGTCLLITSALGGPVVLEQVLSTAHEQTVEATLQLSAATPYTFGYLKNPRRFYLDLKNTQPASRQLAAQQPSGQDLVQSIRVGRYTTETTRIVLDLTDDAAVTVRPSADGSVHLVVSGPNSAAKPSLPVASSKVEPTAQPQPAPRIEFFEPDVAVDPAPVLTSFVAPSAPVPPVAFPLFPVKPPAAELTTRAYEELLLDIVLNGTLLAESQTVIRNSEGYWITEDLFTEGRLLLPVRPPMVALGSRYLPVQGIANVTSELIPETQTLKLTVPPAAFSRTDADGLQLRATTPTLPAPGLFLNHEFQATHTRGANQVTGMLEAGLFSKFGVLTHQVLASNLQNNIRPIRLNTTFVRDFAGRMTTLTLGDTISGNAAWSRPVFFAGVRYSRNFATQPGFISTILPSMSGQANVQSTVDVYVDNVRQLSLPVDQGPFTVRNIPVISSQGELRMVVTDMLGRQQVITDNYIRSTQMLRPGVQEFSYEAGTLRTDYGRKSFAYRSFFASGTQRIGVTKQLTIEGHQEFQPGFATLGLGALVSVRRLGILNAGFASSIQRATVGRSFYLEFSRSQRAWGISTRLQRSTADFRQVGYVNNQKPASLLWQSSVTRAFSNALSVSLGYLQRDGRTELDARALTSSINIRTGRGIITVGGLYSLLNHNQYGASISFTLPWKERSVTTTSGDVSGQSRTASIETRQQVGQGPGVGYRVKQTTLDQQRIEASVQAQDSRGSYQVETVQTPNDLSFRLSERSSISLVQGHLMTSRWLDDSFAVVRVPGAKSVPVYVNNQMLAKTDRRGLALVPWLIPYNRNQVHIDDSVLPLDRSYDMNDRHVVPMRRSGLLVSFEPTSMQGALLVLTQPDGTPLPYGTLVRINGKPEQYQVALRGEVFVNTLSYPATIQASGPAVNCSLSISKTPSNDPLPKLGPLVCKEPR